ncbi:DUF1998 domain-containing protein [Herbidospora yilanensis]|uniref:DUF1998 domain-containing protein n=1 Tax=Herbidospora yilanensis TaxID=354426 RepID=UPI000783FCF4|nr:DUF1998 domain-containing protein [Herbidospora yilanensis]
MVLRNRRTGTAGREPREAKRSPIGAVRRAQMITTYGVGAMIAIDDRSYVVSGLDTWKDNSKWGSVNEPRLQHWLGVTHFQLPPADEPSSGDGVRARMFPDMYSCAKCERLQPFRRFGSPTGKSVCAACDKPIAPSRFVIACEMGHLADFPYFAWVHKKTAPEAFGTEHVLRLKSTGRTASLRSVVISCSCGKEASLQGSFGRNALSDLGIACNGGRPWLGFGTEQGGCPATPRTLQRGSSAAWFPISRSALSIPPWSDSLHVRLNENGYYAQWKTALDLGTPEAVLLEMIKKSGILRESRYTAEDVLDAVNERRALEASARPDSDADAGFEPANRLRREEYEKLFEGTATADRGDNFECVPPRRSAESLMPAEFQQVMLVKRLREVRALQSFTRVEMPDPASGLSDRMAALSTGEVDWLPAIEVSGEGVFITLNEKLLQNWERRPGPVRRAALIREHHESVLANRFPKRPTEELRSPVTPRYVLLHTLAHVLINEWSLDCGYPASALRERLYAADDMAGILIYTATSDSAGSLGGVVAKGEYAPLRDSLVSAVERASWCSQDPPCMESEASGVDSLNLAACYACVLLPETSCETNNVFLDRAMLVGHPDDPDTAFFRFDR